MDIRNKKSILDLFEETVQKFPERISAIDPEKKITWNELKSKAMCAANVILAKVHPKESGYPIAVYSEKSVDLLSTILGINYAGGFYTYLNPEQPADRLKKILTVLEPKAVIVEDALLEQFQNVDYPCEVISFSMMQAKRGVDKTGDVREKINRETPLYGVFTSGSTGVPKCVLVSHGAAMDFINHFVDIFEFTEQDVIGNQAPFDFDVSIKDIVTAYFTGAALVLIPRGYFSTPPRLLDYICDNHVTNLTWAVSALCIISGLKGFAYRVPKEVKRVMFSGEVMPMKHLMIWQEQLPGATFVNLYGPSEITCNCTYFTLNRTYEKDEKLPLGKVFPGRRVVLLDEKNQVITKPNIPGELCVTGESIAIGYYHNEEQTQKHFVTFEEEDGTRVRMYRTGDMAMMEADGEMYFAGRKDFQIKHMGHRIELEEIERSINAVEGVERCICTYDGEKKRLSSYYTGTIEKKELHLFLKEKLPVYMVPSKFQHVKTFILNKNGKIDRKVLDELEVI
ncbi:MAG: AMP-binding protein [Lachnospiraceae bacterium]|nr:AMP-binding protein [Lachnospiraceae bacterium]